MKVVADDFEGRASKSIWKVVRPFGLIWKPRAILVHMTHSKNLNGKMLGEAIVANLLTV